MRRAFLVVGTGRSGTSLVARSLEALGATIPGTLVPPDNTNPFGFGESQFLVSFDNALLNFFRVLGSDPDPGARGRLADGIAQKSSFSYARAWLEKYSETRSVIVLKDPRLMWFLDEWVGILKDLGFDVVVLHVFRNPIETLASRNRHYDVLSTFTSDFVIGGWINAVGVIDGASNSESFERINHYGLVSDFPEILAKLGEMISSTNDLHWNTFPADFSTPLFDSTHRHSVASDIGVDYELDPEIRQIAEGVFSLLHAQSQGEISALTGRTQRAHFLNQYRQIFTRIDLPVVRRKLFSSKSEP